MTLQNVSTRILFSGLYLKEINLFTHLSHDLNLLSFPPTPPHPSLHFLMFFWIAHDSKRLTVLIVGRNHKAGKCVISVCHFVDKPQKRCMPLIPVV